MRVATWNVNSLNARMPRVIDWIERAEPDVLCIQETKLDNESFPHDAFSDLGYESVHHGQGQWNGVAIISRVGVDDAHNDFMDGEGPDEDARIIWATCGGVRIASVYVPNGREVGHEHYEYKLNWLGRLRASLDAELDPASPVIVTGDFNIAPADIDVWDRKFFEGHTHVTEPERDALRAIEEWGLADAFRVRYPDIEGLYSYWDYTAGRFHKRQGIRIDLVLATTPIVDAMSDIVVDRNARKGTKPSDHAPVVIDFELSE